jgi:hypothetical protein
MTYFERTRQLADFLATPGMPTDVVAACWNGFASFLSTQLAARGMTGLP